MNRLYILDVLRFFSAISVVLYHYVNRPEATAFEWLVPFTQYGYLGVPIFFMISGYVIAVSASNRSALGFLNARMIRLFPAYWIGLLFTVVIIFLIGDEQAQSLISFTTLFANVTMLNHLAGISNIDGVYWTLHAELRFYGCIFVLMLLGVFSRFYIWLTLWLLMTLIYGATGEPFFMGWFISPTYSPFFIAGIVFYLMQRDGPNSFLIALLGVTCITAIMRVYAITPNFIVNAQANEHLMSAIIMFSFFIFFMVCVLGVINIKNYAYLPVIGAMTYPLYLIHNVAGRLIIDAMAPFVSEPVAIVVTIGVIILFSYLIAKHAEPVAIKYFKVFLQKVKCFICSVINIFYKKLIFD